MDLLMHFIRWEDQISASAEMKTHLILPHLTDLFLNSLIFVADRGRVDGLVWRSYHFVFLAPEGTSGNILGMVWTPDPRTKEHTQCEDLGSSNVFSRQNTTSALSNTETGRKESQLGRHGTGQCSHTVYNDEATGSQGKSVSKFYFRLMFYEGTWHDLGCHSSMSWQNILSLPQITVFKHGPMTKLDISCFNSPYLWC